MSAHHKSNSFALGSGISLLEVVVALVVIGLLTSLGLTAFNGRADDKDLKEAALELEAMTGRARSLAFLQQKPYRIALTEERTIQLEKPSPSDTETSGYSPLDTFKANVDISLRHWGAKDDDWISFDPKDPEAKPIYWYFSSTGLCEPISIRLLDGENWIVLHMDPLTGRVQEEEYYIANQ